MSDREIRRAIDEGATSVEAVADACGAGSGCGGCAPEVLALLFRRGRVLPLVSALVTDWERAS